MGKLRVTGPNAALALPTNCSFRRLVGSAMLLLSASWWLVLAPAGCSRQPSLEKVADENVDRRPLIGEVTERIRFGETDLAREAARRYLQRFPDDGDMLYNLACLECLLGNTEAGWQALESAFAEGYGDFRRAEHDPALSLLIQDPRFGQLRQRYETQYRNRARRNAFSLDQGTWSRPFPLAANDGPGAEQVLPEVTVQLRFDHEALSVVARVVDEVTPVGDASLAAEPVAGDRHVQESGDPARQAPPWANGTGLIVTIGVPADTTSFETDVFYAFGFGLERGTPVGATLLPAGGARWQKVSELAPRIRIDAESRTREYLCRIPWSSIAPYSPLLDPVLGLNVVYQERDRQQTARRVALVPDPMFLSRSTLWRRYVPVTLETAPTSISALQGAVDATVVTDDPVAIQLVIWAPEAAEATLRLEILSVNKKSIMPGGPRTLQVALTAGRNSVREQADLSILPTGPYSLVAHLSLPEGRALTWTTPLLRLAPGWLEATRKRIAAVPRPQQPSARYRLDAILAAVASARPRFQPAALTATLLELELLLHQSETGGSLLPASGPFLAAYPGSDGVERPCSLYLPRSFTPGGEYRVLVVLADNPGSEPRWAAQFGRLLMKSGTIVVLVPHLEPVRDDPGTFGHEAVAAVDWIGELVTTETVLVAGIDGGGTAALQLWLEAPTTAAATMILTGDRFVALPGVSEENFAGYLADYRHDRGLALVVFRDAATGAEPAAGGERRYAPGRGDLRIDALTAALDATGFRLNRVTVAGDLNEISVQKEITRWAQDYSPADRNGNADGGSGNDDEKARGE